MKKSKVQKKYIYTGFGFPIHLMDVPMVDVRGIWTPDINYNALQKVVLLALCYLPASLSGHHIRFLRKCFDLTLEQFGKKFGVSHAAVLKWEKKGNMIPNISLATEREIRLFVLDSLLDNAKDFRNAYKKLLNLEFHPPRSESLHFDAQYDLIAI